MPVLHLGAFLGAWWLATGFVMMLARLDGGGRGRSLWLSTAAAAAGIAGVAALRGAEGTAAAYAVAACTLAVWAWGELTFYSGAVAGPRTERCPEGCGGA